jgi:XRE family transcriptional regulator, regulator of sulfur utilization
MPPRDLPDPTLARAVLGLRLESAITQEQLARRAGLTMTAVSRIERGLTNPAWTTVRRIARALDVTLAELVAAVERAAMHQ